MLEKPLDAISFLEAHLENNPYNETAWHQLGRQYAITGDYSKAISAFDFAIVIDETFVGAYIEKAKIQETQKNYEQAINNYLITTELEDPTPFAFDRIAAIYERINKPRKALQFYLKAYDLDPSLEKTIIALALLHLNISEYSKSIIYIKKLLAINPKNPEYWKIYADANSRISFHKEAVFGYKTCLDLNKNTLEIYTSLADNYYHIGDYKTAITVLVKAEVYYYQRAEIDYRLAGLYLKTERESTGVLHLKQGLDINKDQYRIFQKLFPIQHSKEIIQKILRRYF
jgi:tetratricopeptide (TPR) repeat protein